MTAAMVGVEGTDVAGLLHGKGFLQGEVIMMNCTAVENIKC